MGFIQELGSYIINTLVHNSPYLGLGIIIASVLHACVQPEQLKNMLMTKAKVSIPGSVAFGAFTPFCACGTMAVVIAMLTTTLPWGPVMAFLTSSPLMSPETFVLLSGVINLRFAIALTTASVFIGLGSGWITHIIEKRTDFLKDQTRFKPGKLVEHLSCACDETASAEAGQCCKSSPVGDGIAKPSVKCLCRNRGIFEFIQKIKWREIGKSIVDIGFKQILYYFIVFAAIGHIVNQMVPTSWINILFDADNIFAVPLAALIGLPMYVNGDASLPLLKVIMEAGASEGVVLAFMITGPGTSAGVIAGIGTVMKKRAIGLYLAFLLVGAVISGYVYHILFGLGMD